MKKILAAAAVALTALASPVAAQDYSERQVMMMVSYGAGGATDFQARIVTMTAGNEDALGMPIAIMEFSIPLIALSQSQTGALPRLFS